jgi:hypothetical protein
MKCKSENRLKLLPLHLTAIPFGILICTITKTDFAGTGEEGVDTNTLF